MGRERVRKIETVAFDFDEMHSKGEFVDIEKAVAVKIWHDPNLVQDAIWKFRLQEGVLHSWKRNHRLAQIEWEA